MIEVARRRFVIHELCLRGNIVQELVAKKTPELGCQRILVVEAQIGYGW
jgi:hypothetical protein